MEPPKGASSVLRTNQVIRDISDSVKETYNDDLNSEIIIKTIKSDLHWNLDYRKYEISELVREPTSWGKKKCLLFLHYQIICQQCMTTICHKYVIICTNNHNLKS